MKIADISQAAARLALLNDKTRKTFEVLLRNWFSTQFIKGASLSLLKSVHQAGAYPAFAQLLAEATDAERVAILAKLDKYRPELHMRPKSEILAHLERLASGRAEAAGKPETAAKPKKQKATRKKVGIISDSKY